MSLNAARDAGIQTADASGVAPGRGRNFLAKLLRLGGAQEDEEESETATRRGKQPAAATPAPARQQLAAVPMPRSRPARAGEFSLASASTSAPATPNDIITSRGYWPSNAPAPRPEREPVAAAPAAPATPVPAPTLIRVADAGSSSAPREAIGPSGERLAWITGPEGQAAPPRPPRDIEGVPAPVAVPDTTASVASWASNPNQNDRIPTELALAYAAATQPEPATRPVPPAPMGSVRPSTPANSGLANTGAANVGNATIATKKPATNSPGARIAQRGMDPWLRGVVMTPSVHHSVTVAVLGAPDYRTLRPLMHKPQTTLAMVFSNDPLLGLTSVQFSGPAVTFLPTINSPTRTAGLN
jgi:hypothetical protein